MEFKLIKEYKLEDIVDLAESKSFIFLRAIRQIHFICKSTLEFVQTIDIPLDNEFGYRSIRAKDDMCFVIVHSEPNPDKKMAHKGDPKKAILKAYNKNGLLWSHPMRTWSGNRNYGGIFILDDCVIFNDKEDEENYIYALDYQTGELIDKLFLKERFMNTGTYSCWGQFSAGWNNAVLFSKEEGPIYKVELASRKLIVKPLLDMEPLVISQNENKVVIHVWDEADKLVLIDKESVEIFKRVTLEDDVDINMLALSPNGKFVVYTLKDSNDLFCVDLSTSEVKWHLKMKEKISQIYIDETDKVYLYKSCDESYIDILKLSDGNNISKIEKRQSNLEPPFFYSKGLLFVSEYNVFNCYKKES